MKRLIKRYSFYIGELEEEAIAEMRNYNINVSRFLRASLRDLFRHLRENENRVKNCTLRIKEKNDLEKYAFLMED